MPELTTMSITVTVAPAVAGGLYARVQTAMIRAETAKRRGRTGDIITNTNSGPVRGTLFQIGKVYGKADDER
ncbi:hypothetical protein ACIA8G_19895 [Lentzea sp. NPDC051213]|uniref:hypothetical protein n=1 Tax=Lentzea sp. NPDC051213 TaxID=3364126 RepID=UPI0037AABC54